MSYWTGVGAGKFRCCQQTNRNFLKSLRGSLAKGKPSEVVALNMFFRNVLFDLRERVKNLLSRVLIVIWTLSGLPSFAASADVKEVLSIVEKRMSCMALFTSARLDQFGLPLQFEVDSEFYSRVNRELHYSKFMKMLETELEVFEDKLTEDEEAYLLQKVEQDSMKAGIQWGVKGGMNISSLDKPYRKCVKDYGLDD